MGHIRSDEVVASALRASDAGVPDALNAERHGVAVKTIRRWRRLYARRGLPRGQAHTRARCPRCDDAPLDVAAYAELLGWYLGDGWIEASPRGVFTLHVYNDVRYPILSAGVVELMQRVKPGGRPHQRLVPGCCVTSVGWKHWPCLFPQHGPGRTHLRDLDIRDWQWPTRVVAGERKRYDYPRWQLVNHSEQILDLACQALDLVGVPWRRSSWKTVSVSTREGVARLDELVGPKR